MRKGNKKTCNGRTCNRRTSYKRTGNRRKGIKRTCNRRTCNRRTCNRRTGNRRTCNRRTGNVRTGNRRTGNSGTENRKNTLYVLPQKMLLNSKIISDLLLSCVRCCLSTPWRATSRIQSLAAPAWSWKGPCLAPPQPPASMWYANPKDILYSVQYK